MLGVVLFAFACVMQFESLLLCNIVVDLCEGKEQSVQAYRVSKSGHPEFQAFVVSL